MSWPPRVRQTNSLTPALAAWNRATGWAVADFITFSRPQMLKAWSLLCGRVSTPTPNGVYRARQTGEDVRTVRSGVEVSLMDHDCTQWSTTMICVSEEMRNYLE